MSPLLIRLLIACALQSETSPKFEVATVKPVAPGGGANRAISTPKGRFVGFGTLANLVEYAWSLQSYQVTGGPNWVSSELFEVTGKYEASEDLRKVRPMLQTLLKERFQLEVRQESKQFPVYFLVQGKKGARMLPADPSSIGNITLGPNLFRGHVGLLQLAHALAGPLHRPVLDHTELKGAYAIDLYWADEKSDGPSVFNAVQEQLGLKLEPGRAPIDLLVITRATHPTPN